MVLKANPLEKVIERNVCKYATDQYGMLVYKFTSPNRMSVPDRLFITKRGYVFFIEFKRKGGKLTAGQEREIVRMDENGIRVYVVDNIEAGRQLIDDISKTRVEVIEYE